MSNREVKTTIPLKDAHTYRYNNFATQDDQVSTSNDFDPSEFRTPTMTVSEEW